MLIRKILAAILLLIGTMHSRAQPATTVDALNKLLATSTEDSSKVNTLLALSNEYRSSNPASAVQYAMEAKTLSEKINYLPGLAYSYKALGLVYVMQGKYIETIENYEKALS